MSCIVCKVNNAAENFQRGRIPSNLTMFRIAVDRLEEAAINDSHAMDSICGRHRFETDEQFYSYVAVRRAQADAKQTVAAFIVKQH